MPSKFDLQESARQEMLRQGFQVDFPLEVMRQVDEVPFQSTNAGLRDVRALPWSSIDSSTSKDLDQIEVAERVGDAIRISVGIADVDAVVQQDSPVDKCARAQGTSVYVPGRMFPMLPEALSTDRTSLGPEHDRAALVIEFLVNHDGTMGDSTIYRALVSNHYQLSFGRVGAWLDRRGPLPDAVANAPEMPDQLRLQDEAAGRLRSQRHSLGALQFDRVEPVPVFEDGQVRRIEARQKNRANDLIEDLMVAANEVMAEHLSRAGISGIRRVVKSPERWPRIRQIAREHGAELPEQPDSGALSAFLERQHSADPDHYPDLSLSILKLMGPGEYVVVRPGDTNAGHFGLAATDYTHSTAPNRRFADLVTQRLIKSVLDGSPSPYSDDALTEIAQHCTAREDAARKVERTMQKRAAAFALRSRVGQTFRGIVTGVTDKGVFARVFDPPVEGRIMQGEKGLDVGDTVRLTLLRTDPENGWIDFGS